MTTFQCRPFAGVPACVCLFTASILAVVVPPAAGDRMPHSTYELTHPPASYRWTLDWWASSVLATSISIPSSPPLAPADRALVRWWDDART